MEPSVGFRVVRGPDWCWEDQDGGEGCVGTVVEVGEGGRSVLVQWDCGIRSWYRSGEEGKFDLRVLDTAPTGMSFPDIICSGCYVEGVAGMHWQCAHCYEYHLCHSCYLLGRHCQEHPFFRVQSKEQSRRIMVSSRADTKKVEAKGIFPGAEVVRGPNWRFGNQDGGAGNPGRVVAIESWQGQATRSVVSVEWSAAGTQTNVYRVGHRGKVDLRYTSGGSCGHYCPENLPVLDAQPTLTYFNEDEVVAGDVIKLELDLDLFRMIHEAQGLWGERLLKVYGECGIVRAVIGDQRVFVAFWDYSTLIIVDTVTKVKYCRVGQIVRIIDDFSQLHQLQSKLNLWNDALIEILGELGRVAEVYINGGIVVAVKGRLWTLDPRSVLPAPGETPPDMDGPAQHAGLLLNAVPVNYRSIMKQYGLSDEVLDGDVTALYQLLISNIKSPSKSGNEKLLCYYALGGHISALKLLLQHGVDPNVKFGEAHGTALGLLCVLVCQEKSAQVLVEGGAHASSDDGTFLRMAMACRCYHLLKTLATHQRMDLNFLDSHGDTALHLAARFANVLAVAILLAAKADPTLVDFALENPVYMSARNGFISVMEVFVLHTPEYLNLTDDDGWTPLHAAARFNRIPVVNLLVAQELVNIDALTYSGITPLHLVSQLSHLVVLECLVGWGADLNKEDSSGNTALSLIIEQKVAAIPSMGSPQIKQVYDELSKASGDNPVAVYVAVVCFLVREGAEWLARNKKGISPHQELPPEAVKLISDYLKGRTGSFHGSLCSTRKQRKSELPQRLVLDLPASRSLPAINKASTAVSHPPDSSSCPRGEDRQIKPSHLAAVVSPPINAPSNVQVTNGPDQSHTDGEQQQQQQQQQQKQQQWQHGPCLLCEERPACVQFSPCRHTVMCRVCAERATKCLICKLPVESKTEVRL